MDDEELAWAVEQACLNAWPSPRQVLLGEWLLRAAGGPSRRLNSLNPLRAARYDVAAAIARAEPVMAALGRPLVVRVPALARGVDGALERLGFVAQHETCTLFRSLDGWEAGPDAAVTLANLPSEAWLALRSRVNGEDAAAAGVVRTVLASLVLPSRFVAVGAAGGFGSIAFGVVDGDLLVIEAVATDPAARGRGLARRAVGALMTWGRRQGARGACLQVLAGNAPARRLYAGLGFNANLYGYGYYSRTPVA